MLYEFDVFLGKKIHTMREKLGLPLKCIAMDLNISLQQLQRYEKGQNRIPAQVIFQLSEKFNVPFEYFFTGWLDKNTPKNNHLFNLLLIEDNEGDEFLIRKALEDFPCDINIFSFHCGEKALKYIRDFSNQEYNDFPFPDIIFLDLNLPYVKGMDILKEIKRRPELQKIPVIILTNSLESSDRRKAYQLHSSGFIRKCFVFDEFKKTLHDTLQYWTKAVILPESNLDYCR